MESALHELQHPCDTVIRVDGVEFQAHKTILCDCSPYFGALFTCRSTTDSQIFDIPNVSPEMMKLIIEFAYTGSVPVTQENIQELFIAADQFNVEGLMQVCSDFLEEQLAPQNCIGIWWFTDVYYNPGLKHKAYLFMLNHFKEVAATSEEFLLLSMQDLAKIIENVKQEKEVFEAIIHWISYKPEERRKHISLLLSKVRLTSMSPGYIMDSVTDNKLVKSSVEPPTVTSALQRSMTACLWSGASTAAPPPTATSATMSTDVCDMEMSRSALSCCVVSGLPSMAEDAAPCPSLQFSNEDGGLDEDGVQLSI